MDKTQFIEAMVELLARSNDIPDSPSWTQLRDGLTPCRKHVSAEELENFREQIIDIFYNHRTEFRKEEIEKRMKRGKANALEQAALLPTPESASSTSVQPDHRDLTSGPQEVDGLQGESDRAAEDIGSRPSLMAISINGEWHGAGLEYIEQERSFVNRRIVRRHNLKLVDGHIALTWKFNDSSNTFVTKFFLDDNQLPDNVLAPDFRLGRKSSDNECNQEDVGMSANRGKKRRRSQLEHPATQESLLRTQKWVQRSTHLIPGPAGAAMFYACYEKQMRESDYTPLPLQPYSHPPQTFEDSASVSSVSNRGFDAGAHPANSRGSNS